MCHKPADYGPLGGACGDVYPTPLVQRSFDAEVQIRLNFTAPAHLQVQVTWALVLVSSGSGLVRTTEEPCADVLGREGGVLGFVLALVGVWIWKVVIPNSPGVLLFHLRSACRNNTVFNSGRVP